MPNIGTQVANLQLFCGKAHNLHVILHHRARTLKKSPKHYLHAIIIGVFYLFWFNIKFSMDCYCNDLVNFLRFSNWRIEVNMNSHFIPVMYRLYVSFHVFILLSGNVVPYSDLFLGNCVFDQFYVCQRTFNRWHKSLECTNLYAIWMFFDCTFSYFFRNTKFPTCLYFILQYCTWTWSWGWKKNIRIQHCLYAVHSRSSGWELYVDKQLFSSDPSPSRSSPTKNGGQEGKILGIIKEVLLFEILDKKNL